MLPPLKGGSNNNDPLVQVVVRELVLEVGGEEVARHGVAAQDLGRGVKVEVGVKLGAIFKISLGFAVCHHCNALS